MFLLEPRYGFADEIIIRYEQETYELSVCVNGKRQENIKSIEISAHDGRPLLDYRCEMYLPPFCNEATEVTSNSSTTPNTSTDPRPIWVKECPVTIFGIKIGDNYYNYDKCESFIGKTVIVSLWPDKMYIQSEDGTMITSNQAPNPRLFNQP